MGMKQTISSLAPAAIALALGACASEPEVIETNTLVGTEWRAEDIEQRGVVDRVQTTLRFETDDRVAGNGGCNRYFGGMTLDGNRVAFGNLGSTMMACPEAVMDQERRFLNALERTSSFRLDLQTGLLYLSDEVGDDLLRFSPLD
jgi:putative lipoprotein